MKQIIINTLTLISSKISAYGNWALRNPVGHHPDGRPFYSADHWTDHLCGFLDDAAIRLEVPVTPKS